jgi:hypothetical protein
MVAVYAWGVWKSLDSGVSSFGADACCFGFRDSNMLEQCRCIEIGNKSSLSGCAGYPGATDPYTDTRCRALERIIGHDVSHELTLL